MIVVAIIGILAAVAIPAFMDYMKRSKKTEAALQLNKIGKNAKRAFSETSQYVIGAATELPAKVATGCCNGGGVSPNHCKAVPASFAADDTWKALDFQIDEDSLFVYDYTGTATSFTALAIGDLDCDTTEITYTLTGTAVNGNPAVALSEPPVNAD
jgi:Tfp pilus assembly protein PilE